MLNHFKENSVLVEGPLSNLKQSSMKFKLAQKFIPERRNANENEETKSVYSYLEKGFLYFREPESQQL